MINTVVEKRIWLLHKKHHTLRTIAEKISNFYLDERAALNCVMETLYEKGVRWSVGQIRTAVKYCYDPRYYTRQDLNELYEKAGFDLDYLPQVPIWWRGITEWENEHKKLRRLGSVDLKAGKDEMGKGAYEFFRTRGD